MKYRIIYSGGLVEETSYRSSLIEILKEADLKVIDVKKLFNQRNREPESVFEKYKKYINVVDKEEKDVEEENCGCSGTYNHSDRWSDSTGKDH